MNFKLLAGLFSILISSIAALNVVDFPMDYRVAPGTELNIKLEGDEIAAGEHVRVELWDNQDDEDINAAIIGEELKLKDGNILSMQIPADFPKTNNAFLRIYYKCHNAVTPRFAIKPAKNCINTKVPHRPTEHPTPIVIYKPIINETPAPTPIIIHAAVSNHAQVAPIAPTAGVGEHIVGPVIVSTPVRHHSSVKSSTIKSTSASTSTSSASVAKFSAGSIAVAMAVAFAMLF